ncbi:hypothetical protein FACS1894200_12110 [Spirochaetia bacterium]|nr:hypothetical protein FACS1894200_12110 [Spirochaetia bacterium]
MMLGLTGELAWWAQHEGSYEQAARILCNKIGIKVSDEFAMEVGQLVLEDNTKKALDTEPLNAETLPQATKEGILYVTLDGSFIRTREKNGDGSSAWKEVKLGMVFSDNDMKVKSDGKKHYITKKAYAVSTEDHEEFSKYLNETAVSCGYGKYEKTIVISDGATWIRNRCKEVFPDGLQILDFYHLCEHVNDAGKVLFNNDPKKYEPWADNIVSLLRQSETSHVLDLLSNDAKTHNCIEKLCNYITNNIDKVDYAAYESAGYLIGSGSIESANKVVVQQRCKRTGQRWNVPTAQLMLSLRAVEESGKWPCLIPNLLAAA